MYIIDGNVKYEYIIDGNYPVINPDIEPHYSYTKTFDKISVLNNDEMLIDLTNVKLLKIETDSAETDSYTDLSKIIIDWGDGNVESIAKKIKPISTLGNKFDLTWKMLKHVYSLEEEKKDLSIKIRCFNKFGTVFDFIIPFEAVYKSLSDVGTTFKIISANIRNDGETAYILKHVDSDSIVFLASNTN